MKSIFGTLDEAVQKGTHADLVDFKFGIGEIDPAHENIQGQAYFLGYMDANPHIQTATIHFIMPRRAEVHTHDYTRDDLENIRLRIKVIVERAESPTPDLRPNTEGCQYCKHRLTCDALHKKLLPLAQKYAPAVDDFEVELYQNLNPANIEDPVLIGKMMNVSQVIDKWGKAVRQQAMKLAEEEGAEIPGYALAWRSPSVKIESAQEAYEAVQSLLSPDEFMDACTVTIPKIAKQVSEKLQRGEKGNARGKVELLLEGAGIMEAEEDRPRAPYLRKDRKLK